MKVIDSERSKGKRRSATPHGDEIMKTKGTLIRTSSEDKRRLGRLARRTNSKTLTEAFRFALDSAEEANEDFKGNIGALREALRHAKSIGGNVSENVDNELAKALLKDHRRS